MLSVVIRNCLGVSGFQKRGIKAEGNFRIATDGFVCKAICILEMSVRTPAFSGRFAEIVLGGINIPAIKGFANLRADDPSLNIIRKPLHPYASKGGVSDCFGCEF